MRAGPLYLLDTNIVGYITNGRSPAARARLKQSLESGTVMISTITEAEIIFGLEKKPEATRLTATVRALLDTLQVRPWDSAAAKACGRLRATLQATGTIPALMDLLIASHAISVGAILVSHDQAFRNVAPFLTVIDWATDV